MTDVVSSMEQQVGSLWDLVEVLQARVISLEAERGVFFHPTPIPNDGFHHCRAANCNKSFETQASLDDHLRSATGPGHQALLALINQTDCQSRDRKVNKTQASVSHESRLHSHFCGYPRDLPSQDANDESYSFQNRTAAFAPSNPFHSNGEKSPSKPEAAAHPSKPPSLRRKGVYSQQQLSHPRPHRIDRYRRGNTPHHGIPRINPEATDLPNDDPSQYTEQNSTEPPTSPPHDNATLHSQANHKLHFLSHFIKKVLQQHACNSGVSSPIPFDKAAFLAAEFPYKEHEIEQQALEEEEDDADDDEEEEECYPLALMSEDDILAEKQRRIGILSAFADGIFEVARLGPEFFCLERVMGVWKGVGDGLGVEGMS